MKQEIITIVNKDELKEVSYIILDVLNEYDNNKTYVISSIVGKTVLSANGKIYLSFIQGCEIDKKYIEKQYIEYKKENNANLVLYFN